LCRVQPSHRERAIGAVCTKEEMLLQPLRWCCIDCVIHHEWDVHEEQQYIYVVRTSNNRVIAACELRCCLLPRCKALCTCRSAFPIAIVTLAIMAKKNGQTSIEKRTCKMPCCKQLQTKYCKQLQTSD